MSPTSYQTAPPRINVCFVLKSSIIIQLSPISQAVYFNILDQIQKSSLTPCPLLLDPVYWFLVLVSDLVLRYSMFDIRYSLRAIALKYPPFLKPSNPCPSNPSITRLPIKYLKYLYYIDIGNYLSHITSKLQFPAGGRHGF